MAGGATACLVQSDRDANRTARPRPRGLAGSELLAGWSELNEEWSPHLLSIIISANNEEVYIGACLDALIASSGYFGPVEIIVSANACKELTVALSSAYVRFRRRQDAGVAEINEKYPDLAQNDEDRPQVSSG